MPTLSNGREYRIDGNNLIYSPEQWPGEPELPDVVLPLRIKNKQMGKLNFDPDSTNQLAVLNELFPAQADVLGELDVFEVGSLFEAWGNEFAARSGVSLGESLPSPDSSTNTEP